MTLFEELKRRNVVRVGVAYAIASWVLLQVADLVLEAIEAPSWVLQALMLVVGLGFIVALVVAWAYELTPEGVKKESEVDRSQSIVGDTGRKLDRIIIGFLVLAVAVLLYRQSTMEPETTTENQTASVTPASPAEVASESGNQDATSNEEKSIAVLPFTTRSTSEDDQFFSDGMHDDLLTQLAKIAELKVISRTSMMEYRETTKNLRQIGQELGVANILEGAVQRVGDKVRINVQLIDAQTDEHLWAETYDREMSLDNLLDIQSEMSRSIARAMQATLSPAEEALIDRQLTDNLEAMEAYRRAKAFSNVFIAENLDRAESELRHALELDPEFAAAWATLAYVHLSRYWGINRDPQEREAASQAIEQGRRIDPNLPELDIAQGYYHYWGFQDYRAALDVLEPVLKIYPGNFEVMAVLAFVNRRFGRVDAALEYLQRALEISPRSTRLIYTLGESYGSLREWDRAQAHLDMLQAVAPGHPRVHQLKAYILSGRDRRYLEAARSADLAAQDLVGLCALSFDSLLLDGRANDMAQFMKCEPQETGPGNPLPRAMILGLAAYHAGKPEEAQAPLEQARETHLEWLKDSPNSFLVQSNLCQLDAALGNDDAALEWCRESDANAPPDAWDFFQPVEVAKGLAMSGHAEASLDRLNRVLSARVGPARHEIFYHPAFAKLHDQPGWQALWEKYPVEGGSND